MAGLDEHGQPLIVAFNEARLCDSRTDELIGICRGILSDGSLVVTEAEFLLKWLNHNPVVCGTYCGQRLYEMLDRVLLDGLLSGEEEDELIELLLLFIGPEPKSFEDSSGATVLPIDRPFPEIVTNGRAFCFTGKFTYGSRKTCENAISQREGLIHKSPTLSTNYLVIGELGSRDWIHSNSGRKIEKAIEYRSRGQKLKIICEEWWIQSLV